MNPAKKTKKEKEKNQDCWITGAKGRRSRTGIIYGSYLRHSLWFKVSFFCFILKQLACSEFEKIYTVLLYELYYLDQD